MARARAVLILLILLLAGGREVWAEARVALVVGNGAYSHVKALPNPVNDAKLVAETLRSLGFQVTLRTDLDLSGMKGAISEFTDAVAAKGEGTLALFYYAGHGVQVAGGNYLIPVDADIRTDRDALLKAVAANDLLRALELAGSSINVIVLDACRDNPFQSASRSILRGLARVEAPTGSLIAYATAPGQTAADGAGANSPYSAALAKALVTPGQTLEQVFKTVRVDVLAETGGKQTPWEESSLTKDIRLLDGPAPTPQAAPAPAPQPIAPQPAADPAAAMWGTLSSSNSVAMLEKFVDMFPASPYAAFAKVRIEELKLQAAPAPVATPAPPPAPEPQVETQRQAEGVWSCDQLWHERNAIFAAKGYCFKSARAVAAFGRGCFEPYGKLGAAEKRRVNELQSIERQLGCP